MSGKQSFHTACACLAIIAATIVLWFRFNAPPGTIGKEFPIDLIHYYLPMTEYAVEQLRRGELPLWNPHSCCGVPFLATEQVALFYPGTWLALFLPVATAAIMRMFIEVVLSGVFAMCFFLAAGAGRYASCIGGILYIFACVLGQTFWPPQVATLVWLPLLLLCVEKIARTPSWTWWALFTLATALQILAGFPQYVVYTFYLLIPYALLRFIQEARNQPAPRRTVASKLLWLGTGSILAVGLTAIQLIPTLELTRNTKRNTSIDEQSVHYMDHIWGQTLRPSDWLKHAVDPSPKLIAFDHPQGAGYLGLPTLAMIAFALYKERRNPRLWFLVAIAAIFGILSFGFVFWNGWLYRLYAALPTGSMFRMPSRMRLLVFFSLICMAVMGLDCLCRQYLHRWPRLGRGVQALLLCLWVLDLAHATGRHGSLRDVPLAWGRTLTCSGYEVASPEHFASVIRDAGLARIGYPHMRPEKTLAPLGRPYAITEYEPLVPRRWTEANQALNGIPTRIMYGIDPREHRGLYDMAGVRYWFVPEVTEDTAGTYRPLCDNRFTANPPPAPTTLKAVLSDPNTDALPRAYLVGQYIVYNEETALRRFAAADFDYHNSVILEEIPPFESAGMDAKREPADIITYSPQRVVIRARSASDRLLVLTDTWFPGWKASVDGELRPILHANYLFRAVAVPAGDHEIIFEYAPTGFRCGLLLTAFSSGVFAAVCLMMKRRTQVAEVQ